MEKKLSRGKLTPLERAAGVICVLSLAGAAAAGFRAWPETTPLGRWYLDGMLSGIAVFVAFLLCVCKGFDTEKHARVLRIIMVAVGLICAIKPLLILSGHEMQFMKLPAAPDTDMPGEVGRPAPANLD